MAFPVLHRLLFGNDGAGPKLRADILPAATSETAGAVKPGNGLTVSDGVMSVSLADFRAELLLAAHPVGSYYWSSDPTSPADLFGGTWQQIQNRFLYASGDYAAGATGGSTSHNHSTGDHALTINEIPAHTHGLYFHTTSDDGNSSVGTAGNNYKGDTVVLRDKNTRVTKSTGGGGSHNHGNTGYSSSMPPYIVAHLWQRTA